MLALTDTYCTRIISFKMALIDDVHNNGFSLFWTIRNFSYCVQETGYCLRSPKFSTYHCGGGVFTLNLFPRGKDINDNDSVVFSLGMLPRLATTKIIDCQLSIRMLSGSFKKITDTPSNISFRGSDNRCTSVYTDDLNDSEPFSSLTLQEVYKNGTDAYLDNDALTIRCTIYKIDGQILKNIHCYAQTTIGVDRITYNWNLENFSFSRKIEVKPGLYHKSFSIYKIILDAGKFEVMIKQTNKTGMYFSTCKLSLLDTEKVLQSELAKHWFEKSNSEQVWTVSFTPMKQFLTNPKKNSTIFFGCDFTVSSGIVEYSKIDNLVYGTIVDHVCPKYRGSKPTIDSNNEFRTLDSDSFKSSWEDNLKCLCSEGKFSDFTIKTQKKEFPIHKAMLCAQSAVFSAMFEQDMKENQTGIAQIEDLEDDTISMMLLFIYTGTVENLDWEVASKLYFAADKYEVLPLKKRCSDFLKGNLSTSNACECLILADMHNDQDLKSVVQDFAIENSIDIIISEQWKELIKEKSQLAAETMHLMMLQNLKL